MSSSKSPYFTSASYPTHYNHPSNPKPPVENKHRAHRYIDIDSKFRDEQRDPNPCKFTVNFGINQGYTLSSGVPSTSTYSGNLGYSGSISGQTQCVLYDVQMEHLIFYAPPGSSLLDKILTLPYVYVIFGNRNNISSHIMYTNNPNSKAGKATFKVAFEAILGSSLANEYLVYDEIAMTQRLHFRPNADIVFEIVDPDGNTLEFDQDTNDSLDSNEEEARISALFKITPI